MSAESPGSRRAKSGKRHFEAFTCEDVPGDWVEPFDIRGATAIMRACLTMRRDHHMEFSWNYDGLIDGLPFENEEPFELQWQSPRYVLIQTDHADVDFTPVREALQRFARDMGVRFTLVGSGAYDFAAGKLATYAVA